MFGTLNDIRMLGRSTAVLALAGSAAAFAPMMSMDVNRRAVVQTGVAGAIAAVSMRPVPPTRRILDSMAPFLLARWRVE